MCFGQRFFQSTCTESSSSHVPATRTRSVLLLPTRSKCPHRVFGGPGAPSVPPDPVRVRAGEVLPKYWHRVFGGRRSPRSPPAPAPCTSGRCFFEVLCTESSRSHSQSLTSLFSYCLHRGLLGHGARGPLPLRALRAEILSKVSAPSLRRETELEVGPSLLPLHLPLARAFPKYLHPVLHTHRARGLLPLRLIHAEIFFRVPAPSLPGSRSPIPHPHPHPATPT
jgi:hypothetical protein